ncbi:F-box domain [Macleaya cordata]|uniref:F-box domain n=1 Tax=Macleaya cordata TaxID=56857 RepID=A0A200R2C3_MACCD|nr:F-box domain [Macleaya cordata]
MENLPPNITFEILSRLPVESLVQCKQVCKTWRTLLLRKTDTKVGLLFSFGLNGETGNKVQLGYGVLRRTVDDEISIDHRQSYKKLTWVDHPSIDKRDGFDAIVGSCNGLVCFSIPHDRIDEPVYICNPTTKEYTHLPTLDWTEIPTFNEISYRSLSGLYIPESTLNRKRGRTVNGFGYHPSTNEYKVVRIYYNELYYAEPHTPGRVQVYTLGHGSGWRVIGMITHKLHSSSGILANGALHWMDYTNLKIVAFDLADEKFRLLPSPPCFRLDKPASAFKLQVLGGYLSVVHQEPGDRVDIWSFKENSNSEAKEQDQYQSWSWSSGFSIPWEGGLEEDSYKPFALAGRN